MNEIPEALGEIASKLGVPKDLFPQERPYGTLEMLSYLNSILTPEEQKILQEGAAHEMIKEIIKKNQTSQGYYQSAWNAAQTIVQSALFTEGEANE